MFDLHKKKSKYANGFRRAFASLIDIFISNIIRMITFAVLGELFIAKQLVNFREAFQTKFDSNSIGRDPEKIRFLMEHQIFQTVLLCLFVVFLVGALYYILLNCSKWQATIGKKLMGLIMVTNNCQHNDRLTLFESLSHYLLSIIPWFFAIYIAIYQQMHQINIYDAIMGNNFNLIFGLITVLWWQVHLFTKKKTTVPDLICQTIVINRND